MSGRRAPRAPAHPSLRPCPSTSASRTFLPPPEPQPLARTLNPTLALSPRCEAVVELASYRTVAGDTLLALSTLTAATELAQQVALDKPTASTDAKRAKARLHRSLGNAYASTALELLAAALDPAEEARKAAVALDAAAITYVSLVDPTYPDPNPKA